MAESPLEKVLRLAGGITRSYVRTHNGQLQRVSSYQSRARRLAWGMLKAGMVVEIAGAQYRVLQAKVPQRPFTPKQTGPNTAGTTTGKNTGSAGAGVNTSGPASTGSAGTGVNAGTSPGALLQRAVLGGQKLPFGTPTVTNELQNVRTLQRLFVYLPPSIQVTVLG